MNKIILAIAVVLLSQSSIPGDIFKIEVKKDFNNYSDADLKKRVWELERAVLQLQQKVFEMEMGHTESTAATWICKTNAMGESFSAYGGPRAVAENLVMEKCKAASSSKDGFFCDKAKCTQ